MAPLPLAPTGTVTGQPVFHWTSPKDAAGLPEESVDAVTLRDALNAAIASRKPHRKRRIFPVYSSDVAHASARTAPAVALALRNFPAPRAETMCWGA